MSLLQKRLIFKKFRVGNLINKTHISLIHEGVNIATKEHVAIKFEKIGDKYDFLQSETFILLLLKGIGIPRVISYGKVMNYKVLVEELLGKSVYMVWDKLIHTDETINDVCLIALQSLDRLEYIHTKNIIHKDIKPANFMFGKKDPNLIYLIDFGMSRKYKSSKTGKHIKLHKLKKINGTMRYMSINTCKGYEHSRRDDLESLGYMLIFLMNNNLPWIYVENENISSRAKLDKICSIKQSISPKKLCQGLPDEFSEYINYCRNLDFEQEPNYNYLRNLFIDILNRNNKLYDMYPLDYMNFSWLNKNDSKTDKDAIVFPSYNSLREKTLKIRNSSVHKRIYRDIKNSIEKKRIKNIEMSLNTERLKPNNKIINTLSANLDDKNKNKNIENKTDISNDNESNSNIRHMIFNKNNINNTNNTKQKTNKKNLETKKELIKKQIKSKIKDTNTKKILNKKIYFSLKNMPKYTNNTYSQKTANTHQRTKANNILEAKILNNTNFQKYSNFTHRENTSNIISRAQFLNNQNRMKNTNLNNNTYINNYMTNNINSNYITSLFKGRIKKEAPKINSLSNMPLNNNYKIEYNFQNTNNYYFNNSNNLSTGRNYINSFNISTDLFDKNDELLFHKYNTNQNNYLI